SRRGLRTGRVQTAVGLLLCLFGLGASAASTSGVLEWNKAKNRVSADIASSDLVPVLERIAAATGWQVFVEPGSHQIVSAKFKEVPPGDALRLMLGDLNYALIPGTNAVSRLFVFRTA